MKDATRSYYQAVVERAAREVQASLDEALDLTALARRAGLAPLHFHRIFRGLIGETPLELHRRLRLERAARTLATSDVAVTRVALDAGYETHESFTRAFRDAFAASPTEFRAAARARPSIATTLAAACGLHAGSPPASPIIPSSKEHLMNVTVHAEPARRVVAVPHRGPYAGIGAAFATLDGVARRAGLHALPGLELVAIYHDDPDTTPAAELRADAGLVVPADVPLPDGLVEVVLPAGTYARTLHRGPYQHLGDAWARFMGHWLAGSGYRVAGPSYERYLNTPMTCAPDELETELLLCVEPG